MKKSSFHKYNDVSIRFSTKAFQHLKAQFNKISKNNGITQVQFRSIMGLLGMETASFLSDRVFSLMDNKKLGVMDFRNYIIVMDILVNGTPEEKSLISFRMLAHRDKEYISFEEFKESVEQILEVWQTMTGSNIYCDKEGLRIIFDTIDKDQDQQISYEDYKSSLIESPDLIDWSEILNKGISDSVGCSQKFTKSQEVARKKTKKVEEALKDVIHLVKKLKVSEPSVNIFNQQKYIFQTSNNVYSLMNPGNTKIMIPSFKTKTGEEETAKGTPVEVEESKPIQSIHSRNPSRQSKKGDEKQFQTEDKTNELNIQRHPSVKQRNMRKDSMCTEFSSSSEETEQEVSKQEALNAPKKDTILDKMKEMQKQLQGMDNEFKNSIVEATRKEDKDVKKSFIESFKNRENGRRTVVFRTQKLSINKIQEVRHNADATNLVNIIDENWNLILNMMLGMRNSATSVHDVVKLTGDDFNVKYVFELVPRRKAGSVQTKIVSRFFDYAPNVFFKIRVKFCKFETTDYIKSIGPEQLIGNLLLGNITSLQEQCSEGKSGSFFYYTHCGRFVIKTIPHTEFRFLLKVLPKYFKHLEDHPHSLIIKVLGMHKIFYDKRKIYFIVMQNVFASSLKVDTKYDLKGSTVGRKVRINTEPLQGDFALKDLDLIDDKVKICIHPKIKFMLIKELFSDINFLSSINTDDYSFMLGIHRITDRLEVVSHKTNLSHYLNFDDSVEERPFPFFTVNEGGILSNDCSCVYFFGIIDILTEYGPKKQLEYFFKRIKYGKQMSVLPPQEYAERIMNFINSIID